jgi:choline-glycine betaine transporter
MGSTTSIMWGVLFGSIGMGYLIYGRKQQRGIALLSGIVLCAFPYFISNIFLMIFFGVILMALPYFIRY